MEQLSTFCYMWLSRVWINIWLPWNGLSTISNTFLAIWIYFLNKWFSSLNSKYYIFETWLLSIVRPRVVASISFIFIREMMVWVAKQYLKDPKTKLFPNFENAQGVRKIKELIKPTNFTINNLNTYVSINYKCSKINMNIMPLNSFTLVSN